MQESQVRRLPTPAPNSTAAFAATAASLGEALWSRRVARGAGQEVSCLALVFAGPDLVAAAGGTQGAGGGGRISGAKLWCGSRTLKVGGMILRNHRYSSSMKQNEERKERITCSLALVG